MKKYSSANSPIKRRSSHDRGGHHPNQNRNSSNDLWLYGRHAVFAALTNPLRKKYKLKYTNPAVAEELKALKIGQNIPAELVDQQVCETMFPGRRTQGILLSVEPLAPAPIKHFLQAIGAASPTAPSRLLILDHLQDERNIGAMFRSAYLLGINGIVLTRDHAPKESGDMAQAACGAMDRIPVTRVTNLVRCLKTLSEEHEYWCVALDLDQGPSDESTETIENKNKTTLPPPPSLLRMCLIVGSEAEGLRPSTRRECQYRLSLPTPGRNLSDSFAPDSFNASTAVALGLARLTNDG